MQCNNLGGTLTVFDMMTQNGFPLCKIGNNDNAKVPSFKIPMRTIVKIKKQLYFVVFSPHRFIFVYWHVSWWIPLCYSCYSAYGNLDRGGRGRHGGRECCCYGEFLCTVRIFKSVRLQSVQPENHRAENQPDSSLTGGNVLCVTTVVHVVIWVNLIFFVSSLSEHRTWFITSR